MILEGEKKNDKFALQTANDIKIVEHQTPWGSTNIGCGRIGNWGLTKDNAIKKIRKPFETAKERSLSGWLCGSRDTVEIYYTGDGAAGDWRFDDGLITLNDILVIAKEYSAYFDSLNLVLQACQSGNWCKQLRETRQSLPLDVDVNIYASSWPGRDSRGDKDGSYWTRFMYQKDEVTDEKDEIRWTRASLNKYGSYTITHMKRRENVQAKVVQTDRKVSQIRSITQQIDLHNLERNQILNTHGGSWNSTTMTVKRRERWLLSQLMECIVRFCSLKADIDSIQGASYLEGVLGDRFDYYTIEWTQWYQNVLKNQKKTTEDDFESLTLDTLGNALLGIAASLAIALLAL